MKGISTKPSSNEPPGFAESLSYYGVQALVYSAAALAIYFIGTYFWWPGFVLFVLVTLLWVIPHFLFSGILVLLITCISGIVFASFSSRRLSAEKFAEIQRAFGSLGIGMILLVAQQLYILGVFIWLG